MKLFREPFRHWIDRNFVPASVIDGINAEWPDDGWTKEEGKGQLKWHQKADRGHAAALMAHLNSRCWLDYLEDLTGIEGLQADIDQYGGGLHSIPPGGFLGIHTDFQYLPNGWRRRLNLLLYLNRDWQAEYGGDLELHGKTVKSISPVAGCAVLFPTTKNTWHGHPTPHRAPVHRRSFAVYYYTEDNGVHDKTVYR